MQLQHATSDLTPELPSILWPGLDCHPRSVPCTDSLGSDQHHARPATYPSHGRYLPMHVRSRPHRLAPHSTMHPNTQPFLRASEAVRPRRTEWSPPWRAHRLFVGEPWTFASS